MRRYTKEYIGKLLDKYMDGTSTLDEEAILCEYFRGKDIPQEWENYRQLFQEIEEMRPQPKAIKRWMGWSVAAAAIVAAVLYLAIPSKEIEQLDTKQLTAKADTTAIQQTKQSHDEQMLDTASIQKVEVLPIHSKKRRLRKPQPTMTDYDKAYTLMAEAEQGRQEAELQIAKCQHEIIEAHLAAYGYIPVMQEDGTIIYINEQTESLAYEE